MNALIIANTQIRRDVVGRYCLNDLHQASGGEKRHQPNSWLVLGKTRELITELEADLVTAPGIPGAGQAVTTLAGGNSQGTYAVKELVYAYAMWISAKFHLHVIRAYDAMVTGEVAAPPAVPAAPMHRADVLVSAARGFGALVRAGRTMGLGRQRAVVAANAATFRATGIDLVEELEAADVVEAPAPEVRDIAPLTDPLLPAIASYLAGKQEVTLADVITHALNRDPESREWQTKAGIAMRRLGWCQYRPARGGDRTRIWRPMASN